MKKLNLKSLGIESSELLTREQMKMVVGGTSAIDDLFAGDDLSRSGAACMTNMDCQLSTGYHYCCFGFAGGTCKPCN